MRKAFGWVLVLCAAAGLSACGDKGGGGGGGSNSPVGSWTFDVDKVVKMAEAVAEKQLSALTPEQRKAAETQMGGSPAKKIREMFEKVTFDVTFKADGTATMNMAGMPGVDNETGEATWKLDGTKLTVTPTKKNGKPVEGEDAKAKDMTFKDGVISMDAGGQTIELKRK